MFYPDELDLKSGLHRTYVVHTPANKEAYMTMEIELVLRGKVIFALPVWRYKNPR
jgi:hypothetical protein